MRSLVRLLALATSVAFVHSPARALEGDVGKYSNAVIQGHILEPSKLDAPTDTNRLKAPDDFRVTVFARDLVNPRMLAVSDAGNVYVTRRSIGDVVMLKDEDGDGRADSTTTVASRPDMHGIALHGRKAYLATVKDIYTADIREDGSFGDLQRIVNDLPDAGQHPNRTLAIGPDGMLYVSVGSTCNACAESSPESATLLRVSPDGKSRTIFASGLRNTIGFGWHPRTGELWGMDHGIDWLGDNEQIEELNRIEQGKRYGWPYIYGMGQFNPQDNPPGGITLEQWRSISHPPVLGYTAHAAPMQMAFYTGEQFPQDYRGDAFVAMRGSWNRKPPSGYEVARVRFENGKPASFEPFLTGFLIEDGSGQPGFIGRPTGIAVAGDGSLLVADDSNGVIYRVSYAGPRRPEAAASAATGGTTPPETPARQPAMPRSDLAIRLTEAKREQSLQVTSAAFQPNGTIPLAYSAYGDNASPPLAWSGAPDGTKSFVIMVDDPDAATAQPFNHWVAYNIPADETGLREGLPTIPRLEKPEGVLQGQNTRGATGYFGMKPPPGDPAHRYYFQVFALDRMLDLQPGASREEVLGAMRGHVLAEGELVGTFAQK